MREHVGFLFIVMVALGTLAWFTLNALVSATG